MTAETSTDGIVLTDSAASKVKTLLEAEGRDDLTLRIAVQPGGCSGLRYQLFHRCLGRKFGLVRGSS